MTMTENLDANPNASADPLEDLPGVVASVLMGDDGRTRQQQGLDPATSNETGHFVASVNLVLDTLVHTWSEIVQLDAAPLQVWLLQSGRYWLLGAGLRAWVLDPEEADLTDALGRLHDRQRKD